MTLNMLILFRQSVLNLISQLSLVGNSPLHLFTFYPYLVPRPEPHWLNYACDGELSAIVAFGHKALLQLGGFLASYFTFDSHAARNLWF